MNDEIKIKKRNFFKKYNTLETLKCISNLNIESFKDTIFEEKCLDGIEKIEKEKIKKAPFCIPRIALNVIKYSNDFRGNRELSQDDICIMYNKIINEFSYNVEESKAKGNDLVLEIVVGHSQEQFWYQTILNNFFHLRIRNKKILSYYSLSPSINEILSIELGVEINCEIFERVLSILVSLFCKKNIYFKSEIIEHISNELNEVTSEQVIAVLNYYTCDYNWIKSKNEKDRPFIIKPILKLEYKEKYIIVDIYSLLFKQIDGIYWIVRNYFHGEKIDFPSNFGIMFENYINDLLVFLLKKEQFEKLNPYEDKKTKSLADWLIKTKNYNLIVEQKSTLLASANNVMEIDIENLKVNFLSRIEKAFIQLKTTEKSKILNDKETIKIVLLYENIQIYEIIKKYYNDILKEKITDIDNYLFISCQEFEILICLLKSDETLFEIVLKERLEQEKKLFQGANFYNIFEKYNFLRNEYIKYLIEKDAEAF